MKGKDLRIVFMGTPDFAVETLKCIHSSGYTLAGVITAPDRPAGRGRKLRPSAVKKFTLEHLDCPVFQPGKLRDKDFLEELEGLNADLFIVVAFRMLPEAVWSLPRLGTFNLHASLLPQYRGAAPINWALINGETETGLTTFMIDHEIDTGKILLQEKTPIGDDDNFESLHDRMMAQGAGIVLKTIELLAEGLVKPVQQDELHEPSSILKPAPKLQKEHCKLDWDTSCRDVVNFVRGLSPIPAAYTHLQGPGFEPTLVKIFSGTCSAGEHSEQFGSIRSDNKSYLEIAVNNGHYSVEELQLAGKKRMDIKSFLSGFQADLNSFRFGL